MRLCYYFYFSFLYKKRQKFEDSEEVDDQYSDNEEEQPQVVVIKTGDLTADEAEREQLRIEKGLNIILIVIEKIILILIHCMRFYIYISMETKHSDKI